MKKVTSKFYVLASANQVAKRAIPFGGKHFILLFTLLFQFFSGKAQNYFDLSTGNYLEQFTGWTGPASGVNWSSVPISATGTVPSATKTTVSSATFGASTSSSGGVQLGTGSILFLSTGSASNTTAVAFDLNLNFSNRTPGNLTFDATTVFNSTGNREASLKVYYTTDGTTWTELTGTNLPYVATNNVAGNASIIAPLPAALAGQSQVKLRFYNYNGTGTGTAGSRPKINLDNVAVTSIPNGVNCTAAPTSVSVAASATSVCPNAIVNLNGSIVPSENGQVYQWEVSPDDVTYSPIAGATSTSTVVTVTSSQYYRLSAACGMGTPTVSTGVQISPISTSFPYLEAFSGASLPTASCWTLAKGQLAAPTSLVYTGTTWTTDGWLNSGTTGAARLNITGTGLFQWLQTPSFTLSGANKQLEFDIALTAANGTGAGTFGSDDKVSIVISTDNGATWSSANELRSWNSTSSPALSNLGEHVIIDLTAYANTSVKIGFYGESTVTNNSSDLFIDNVTVVDIPLCATPSLFSAVAGTNSDKATLSWTAPTTAPSSYDWLVVATGAGVNGTPITNGNVSTTTVITPSSLVASTTYDAYVRSDCSTSNSNWIGPVTFTTECASVTTFSQTFEPPVASGTGGTIPSCWNRQQGGGSSYVQGSNAAPWSGTQRYIFIASTGQTPMAISPVVSNLNDTTQQLRFRTFVSSQGVGKTLEVGYITDPNNVATFTKVKDITINNTAPDANWTIVQMPITAPASGYLAWRHPGTASYNLYFDDVFWESKPLCGDISNLAATSVTTTGFKMTWTAPTTGTPTAYNYEIRTSGAIGSGVSGLVAAGTITSAVTDTTFTTLPSGRRLALYVQTDCGAGTTASWFGPIFVNTLSNNDECTSAIDVSVNPDLLYTNFITASTAGATQSAGNVCNPLSTTNPNNDDIWLKFTATDIAHEIKFFNPFGGSPYSSDVVTAVYSGTCASLVQIDCQDPEIFTVTGLTPGDTYYLRTFSKSTSTTTISTQNFGIGTPPAMTYSTATATNIITTDVNAGSSNAQILRVEVEVNGANAPLTLTKIGFNTNGTTSLTDVSTIKAYFTGSSTTFSTATPFGNAIANPTNTTIDFTGSQKLIGGGTATKNYFWLVYDVACSATVSNKLDAELEYIEIGGNNTSLLIAPVGDRNIIGNSAYDTKASGNWNDPNTWACGVPPTGTTAPINISHDVSVDTNVDINSNVTITAAKKLTIQNNTFTTGSTGGGNKAFTVNGILEVLGSTLTINGNLDLATGSTFTMPAGNVVIDPNNGTAANSVASGLNTLNIATSNFNMTGGKITIVDANYNSVGNALNYSGAAHINLTGGTIAFGDGISTTDYGLPFIINTFTVSTGRLALYNYEININNTGLFHYASNTTGMAVLNDFNILSGEFRSTSGFNVAGNWVNNGKFTSNNTVYLLKYASMTSTASTLAQTISGTGIFEGTTAGTNFTSLQINNTNAAGVTFVNDITVSGTLTVAQGAININNLMVGTSASSIGSIVGNAGWINGTLTKWFSTATGNNTAMRVGTSITARVATVNFTQALSTGGTLSAKFTPTMPSTAGLPMIQGSSSPVNIETISPTGFWTVAAGNGLTFGTNTAYTFTANATGFTESNGTTVLSNLSQIRLIKRADSASPWLPIGSTNNPGSGITPTSLASVQAQSLKSFSDFAIGGTNVGIGVVLSLQGKAYLANVDTTTGLMNNYLATLGNFPLSDPYSTSAFNTNFVHVNSSATATTTATVLATTGANAIVDWVFLELRTGTSGSTSVAQTKAALIQADGDIVGMDGVSPVTFSGNPGSFYVTVRHRNHLGFRTENLIALSNTPTALDFTNGSVTLHGAYPVTLVGTVSPKQVMNGGDSNSDGSVDAFDTIQWEIQNGLFDDYSLNADYNMDGSVDAFDTIIWEVQNGKYQELD